MSFQNYIVIFINSIFFCSSILTCRRQCTGNYYCQKNFIPEIWHNINQSKNRNYFLHSIICHFQEKYLSSVYVIKIIYVKFLLSTAEKVLEDLCTITRWLNGPGKDDSIGKPEKKDYFLLLKSPCHNFYSG